MDFERLFVIHESKSYFVIPAENAVKTQHSTYEVLQILGGFLLDKTPLNQLLQKQKDHVVKELLYNQLKMW